ncbi:GntR family transcriptional regulator [Streptomyces sp. NPDC059063]|uniref:GntR family transcriptional regulator n=1 Tax=unclassified Streptomyces TaxID=2593676 RepID=UPI0036BEB4FE
MVKTPKWRAIADSMAAKITDGTYAPGQQLPQIADLVREGIGSTATVHRAYQTLEAEGLVKVSRGHGTRVLRADEQPTSLVTGAGRLAQLRRTGRPYAPGETAERRFAGLRSCADPQVAEELGVELYDEIVVRSRVFVREGRATVLALNFIHPRALGALPELLDAGPTERFRHDLYKERTGQAIVGGPQRASARPAASNELSEFGIDLAPDQTAAVLVLRTLFSDDDGPLELWEDVHRPGIEKVID